MEPHYQTIIVVTETSHHSRATEQTALDLAKFHDAKVIVVDCVHRPSIVSKIISSSTTDLFDLVAGERRDRLDRCAATFQNAGVDASARLLVGNSSIEIAHLAEEVNADLVVRYAKGLTSRIAGPVGTTARNLMRACPCPLLLVTGDQPISNPTVLACVNAEHPDNESDTIISTARKFVGEDQSKVLYCWDFYGNEYMAGYVSDDLMCQYMDQSERNYRELFSQLVRRNGLELDDPHVHMKQGHASDIIPQFCKQSNVDVVVVSSVSQNHPLRRLMGSTMELLLNEIPCSLLVVKPQTFTSPLQKRTDDAQSADVSPLRSS